MSYFQASPLRCSPHPYWCSHVCRRLPSVVSEPSRSWRPRSRVSVTRRGSACSGTIGAQFNVFLRYAFIIPRLVPTRGNSLIVDFPAHLATFLRAAINYTRRSIASRNADKIEYVTCPFLYLVTVMARENECAGLVSDCFLCIAPRSSVDRALPSGGRGRGFESLRARNSHAVRSGRIQSPRHRMDGIFRSDDHS